MNGKQTWAIAISTVLVFFFSAFTAITMSSPVYADYTPTNGKCNGSDTLTTNSQGQQMCQEATSGGAGSGAAAQQAEGTTCAVEKIGWILCPIIEGSAKLADFAFKFLADNFLAIEPELLTATPDGGKGTITAWGEARNLANIMFVIAFIIIVYSQITGAGLNNYGIKRMLPRLIVAAIAVNVSYYICQTIVDLSNILGYNIMQALQDLSNQIGPQVMGIDPNQGVNTQTSSTGGILTLIALSILPLAGLVWLMSPVLGSVVLFILITCITIIIILLLRKAFIVLLVVISPLAFVMYLLPNTEKYFSKWLDMFWKLLLVFPIVALLLGGGQLASTIILVAGSQEQAANCDPATTNTATTGKIQEDGYGVGGECSFPIDTPQGQRHSGMTLGLVAAGIAVAPLLAVWSVLQGALSAAGAIGGKIGGAINNVQGRQKAKLGKKMAENSEYRRNQLDAAALRGTGVGKYINRATLGSARRGAKRRAKGNYAKSELHRAETDYIADQATQEGLRGDMFRRSMAGGVLGGQEQRQRVIDNAQNAQNARQNEEVKAASVRAETMDDIQLKADLDGDVNSPQVAAAISELAKRQDFDGLEKAINKFAMAGPDGKAQNSLASRTLGSSISQNNPGLFTAGQLGSMSRGASTSDYQSMVGGNLADGILSPEKMADSGPSVLQEASRVAGIELANGNAGARDKLISASTAVYRDPKLANKLGRNATAVSNVNAGLKHTPGPNGGTWS